MRSKNCPSWGRASGSGYDSGNGYSDLYSCDSGCGTGSGNEDASSEDCGFCADGGDVAGCGNSEGHGGCSGDNSGDSTKGYGGGTAAGFGFYDKNSCRDGSGYGYCGFND